VWSTWPQGHTHPTSNHHLIAKSKSRPFDRGRRQAKLIIVNSSSSSSSWASPSWSVAIFTTCRQRARSATVRCFVVGGLCSTTRSNVCREPLRGHLQSLGGSYATSAFRKVHLPRWCRYATKPLLRRLRPGRRQKLCNRGLRQLSVHCTLHSHISLWCWMSYLPGFANHRISVITVSAPSSRAKEPDDKQARGWIVQAPRCKSARGKSAKWRKSHKSTAHKFHLIKRNRLN